MLEEAREGNKDTDAENMRRSCKFRCPAIFFACEQQI